MKNKGFTLAEVLITLGIIGVVSAVTLPTLMSNSQYKQLGVKLSKFHSTLENNATAYVNANGEFPNNSNEENKDEHIKNFVNDTYMFKETYSNAKKTSDNILIPNNVFSSQSSNIGECSNYGILKDGTYLMLTYSNNNPGADRTSFPVDKYGNVAIWVVFGPNVKGLPADTKKFFTFYVTSKGYVIPPSDSIDYCTKAIFDADFNVTSSMFKNDGACTKKHYS